MESAMMGRVNWTRPLGDQILDLSQIPDSTQGLKLRKFILQSTSSMDWDHLNSVTDLVIEDCNLESISARTWASLPRLEHLDITRNPSLVSLQDGAFLGLGSLRTLDLSSNGISTIGARTFLGLPALEHLSLRKNCLRSIDPNAFLGLVSLRYLNVAANNLTSVPPDAFNGLKSLSRLILAQNALILGPRPNRQCGPHSLDSDPVLPNQKIRLGDFESFPHLTLLVLDDNNISKIEDDAFGRHEELKQIWLNNNHLTSVPGSLPKALKVLYLEENLIQTLEADSFPGLVALEALFLRRNLISHVAPDAFRSLASLRTLNLVGNSITSFEWQSFAGLEALQRLDISLNPLIKLSNCFQPFISLKVLKMGGIKSRNVSVENQRIFSSLERLEELELRGSPGLSKTIIESEEMLKDLSNVRSLDLSNNGLKFLGTVFFELLGNLESLDLRRNEWACENESILVLAKELSGNQKHKFLQPMNIKCSSPVE
ncbi:unnamed protein product, partial [Notodromas monacha]